MGSDRPGTSAVTDYYASFARREWERLETPEGAVEWDLTCALLAEHLPPPAPGVRVLDVGGGPGRYARWLTEAGYDVTLVDLSPDLVDIARVELGPDADVRVGDVRDLGALDDAAFDAVLCLGPLYHLPDADDRTAALTELGRVARPGAPIAVALMSRYLLLRRTLAVPDERHRLADATWVDDLMTNGVFHNDVPGRFTHAYGVDPRHPAQLFDDAGWTTAVLASTHSLVTGIEDAAAALGRSDPEAYARLLGLLLERASDPTLFGTAGHLLWIGHR